MLRSIVGFELRYAVRQPTFWLISGAYFLFALVYSSTSLVGEAMTTPAINVNSPWAITRMVTGLSYLSLLGLAAFVGASVIRDARDGMAELLFVTRLTKAGYVFGRFLGGFLAVLLSFSFVFVGLIAGHLAPWADPRLLGPFPYEGLAAAFLVFALPNLLIGACILYSIALLTRDTLATYAGAVAILVGYLISRAFAGAFYATQDARMIASLAEPFGGYASMMAVLDWTPFERNTVPIWTQASIGVNRALWLGVSIVLVGVAYRQFGMRAADRSRRRGVRADAARSVSAPVSHLEAAPAEQMRGVWQLACITAFDTRRVLRSKPFIMMVLLAAVGLWFYIAMYGRAYGAGFLPHTEMLVTHIRSVYLWPLSAVLIFYAAELTWSARMRGVHALLDATPVTNAVRFSGRCLCLALICVIMLGSAMVTALLYQLYRGFYELDPWRYAIELGVVQLPYFAVLAALALFYQALVNNRFAGMALTLATLLFAQLAPTFGVSNNLLIPGGHHEVRVNAMNGFGHYLEPVAWFHLWWLLIAVLLSVCAALLTHRGADIRLSSRTRAMRGELARPGVRLALAVPFAGLIGVGSFIAYNTMWLNPTPSDAEREAKAVAYEARYGSLRDDPFPHITRVRGELKLYPRTRHFVFDGSYDLNNRQPTPLRRIVLTAPPETRFGSLTTDREAEIRIDERHGVATIALSTPLEPMGEFEVRFEVASEPIRGFRNRARSTPVACNGSLLWYDRFMPVPGYSRKRELSDALKREARGLPPRPSSVRAMADPRGLQEHEGQPYADWLEIDLMVETDAEQIAVAQGALIDRSRREGRATYRYATQVPVKLHMGVVSGTYQSVTEMYDGTAGRVEISIFHFPGHGHNVQALMDALKDSLATLEAAFGPYPYDRLRLVEIAMGKPTFRLRSDTILCDSSLGFINDPRLDDPRSPPGVLRKLSASMVANQFVQSLVMPANRPGATSIADGLGFYLSGLVWARDQHPRAIAEAIRDTAWHYFIRRATFDGDEATVVDHVNQTHVGAHKHAVALYGLELYLGRETMIEAIRGFIEDHRLKAPPFASMADLVQRFRSVAPPDVQPIITDLFERRVIFDIAVVGGEVVPLPDGRFEVVLSTRTRKFHVSPRGESTETSFDYPLPIVAFGRSIDASGARRIIARHMASPEDLADGKVTVIVDRVPTSVGVDPFYRLLDRNLLDNRLDVP